METRTYEREKLYREVWAEPMTTVCKRYGISDVALRKHCKKLEIPLPPNGYWSKVKAGYKTKIPPLPKYKGPEKIVVPIGNDNYSPKTGASKKSERLLFLPEIRRQELFDYSSKIIVPEELVHPHGLIKDTIQYHRSRKESTRPPVNRVFNINVSSEHKERVYRIYNTLFLAFEHLGYSVEIKAPKAERYYRYAPRVNDNVIFICQGKDGVPIFIKEKQQRVEHIPTKEELEEKKRYSYITIPLWDYIKTGKLNFEIDEYHLQRKNWRDTDHKKLEDQIGEITIWVIEAINVVKVNREQREEEKKRWEEDELIRQQRAMMRQDELKLLNLLEEQANDWDRAEKIRKFANQIELKFAELDNGLEKEKITKWLKWAREKADWLDPLSQKEDEILGKGNDLFNLINQFEIDGEF